VRKEQLQAHPYSVALNPWTRSEREEEEIVLHEKTLTVR
jgi:hypothetical protein